MLSKTDFLRNWTYSHGSFFKQVFNGSGIVQNKCNYFNFFICKCDARTDLWGFRPGLTHTDLYSDRSRLEALNFRFKKERNCTIDVVKAKALISFAVTVKLICTFVFACAKIRFSHDAALEVTH